VRPLILIPLAAAVVLLVSAGGCARPAASAGGPVTIRYTYWGNLYEVKVWDTLARRFNSMQSRVRVKLEHVAGMQYHPKILAMAIGRCAPDVMACDDEPFPELADDGIFEDLGPWMARDAGFDPAAYYPQFFQPWIYRGNSYAIPYLGHCLVVYYNKAHLRAAGLPEPAKDWTWEDFLRYTKALTRDLDGDGKIDRFGFMRPFNFYHSLPWFWSAGGNELEPDLKHCRLSTAEGLTGIRWCYDLVHKHHVTPLMTELPGMPLENMFLTGRISMLIHGAWWLTNCRREPGLEWDVQLVPHGPNGPVTRATCEAIAMSASSKHKAEAWEWIRFVVGPEGQKIIAGSERGMPAMKAVCERLFPKPETPQHEERFLEMMKTARSQRIPLTFVQNMTVINREWDLMLLGHRTPEQLAANVDREVNRIMAEPR
jgi:multiple sugar transport system substrate-binding protein